MQITAVLYIILALLLSFSVAFFQYFYKVKNKVKINFLLFLLKSISLFLLILLLINPIIKKTEIQEKKPVLSILADNSKSISYFKESINLKRFLDEIKADKSIGEKYEINEFAFGTKLGNLDSLSFTDYETNVSKAITFVNQLNRGNIAPVILLTDGNQTIGNDYEFIASQQKIYPIVFGDTIEYKDLKISQLNVNKYSYIKNKFPVEVLLNYSGKENVTSQFSISKNGKAIFTEKVQFSPANKSKTITTNLTSTKEGLHYYTASIRKIKGEKNTKNNTKNFSVEVIDEQTKILVLASVLHPDLGALKKSIESNKQRSVDVFLIDDFKKQINDYQLVVLFQPNKKFNKLLSSFNEKKSNYFLITGANTDWSFINKKQLGITKNSIKQIENYGGFLNNSFLNFVQKDIGFNQFSPLIDVYGEVTILKEYQTLLFQSINGLETKQPLLATFEENNQKSGVLLGEGLWKWRAASFLNSNSFHGFDEFIGNLIQYLASNKRRSRLEINAENLYPANSTIKISALYIDKNYQFDARASLEITITNQKSKKVTKIPFSVFNNWYQAEIENLVSGIYNYKVSVIDQNIHNYGKFKIADFQIEEEFTNANYKKLLKLANKSGGKLYFKNEIAELKKLLLEDKTFFTTQKLIVKEQSLIDWKWVLLIIALLLSIEWFVRKYFGKL